VQKRIEIKLEESHRKKKTGGERVKEEETDD
jgi:hypothetical protein